MELKKSNYHLYPNYGIHTIEVYNYKLANKLNRLLKTYDSGLYRFKEYEEARFMVNNNMLLKVLLSLKVDKKFLKESGVW